MFKLVLLLIEFFPLDIYILIWNSSKKILNLINNRALYSMWQEQRNQNQTKVWLLDTNGKRKTSQLGNARVLELLQVHRVFHLGFSLQRSQC